MTDITVTGADVGNSVYSGGLLNSIHLVQVPDLNGYKEYITLVDDSALYALKANNPGTLDTGENPEITLFNFDPSTSYVGAGSNIFQSGNILFGDLTVKSMPSGCSISVNIIDFPTADTLTPDTAVLTDPPFELTVTGTNFTPSTVIQFGGNDMPTTFVDDTTLTTEIDPANYDEAIYTVTVRLGPYEPTPLGFTFTST
jgi:hypothetical protein